MIGKTISHYKILEKLGEGGMGVVYKAEDTKLKRQVALKFLPAELTRSDELQQRFLREAQAAAALAHPGICHTYEIDEADDQAFIAMEYVDGASLAEKIESGPFDIDKAVSLALQVAEGLKHAHKRGIVHRDIKPANVMIAENGQVKIMDFGLAKLSGKTRLTKTATIMGTVAYMSPEQARGDSAIDHCTDVWSLGVLLYEMLTGALPFDAETDTGLIYKIVNEEPRQISSFRNDIPSGLEGVIQRMLQKRPQDRYEDIGALIPDLESARPKEAKVKKETAPSIAVLPFVNMSADPEQEYFCDGLSEELINALTQLSDLRVIARTSAFSFKGKDVKIRDIGKELDVGTVLEGSVRKAGNRLRITAQLIDVSGGHHLWSEKYDRDMEDVFAIQDEITETIVDKLKPKLLREEKAKFVRRQTVDLEAYNLYLKGRWFWGKSTASGLKNAIQCFEKAIARAPDFALAYSGLADSYFFLPYFESAVPKEAYPKAREAALKALEIDDTVAEAHASLAMTKAIYEWDWEGADKSIKRAIELTPGYAWAHHGHAMNLMFRGRFDEAIEEMNRALELDPLSLFANRDAGQVFLFARKPDRAIEMFRRALEMDPNYGGMHSSLGAAYWLKSMYEEAIAEFEKEKKIASGLDPVVEHYLGIIDALTGRMDEARKVLEKMVQRSKTDYFPGSLIAVLSFALGEIDEGFEWLEKAYEQHDNWLSFLKANPIFDTFELRSDPRYISLLRKMNLEP